MNFHQIPEIERLSAPEKILLIEDLWDSIISEETKIPIPQSHIEKLQIRQQRYDSNPGNLLSLEELQARVAKPK